MIVDNFLVDNDMSLEKERRQWIRDRESIHTSKELNLRRDSKVFTAWKWTTQEITSVYETQIRKNC